jgi:alkaline phosphatase D
VRSVAFLVCTLASLGCSSETLSPAPVELNGEAVGLPSRVGFGSCSDPRLPLDALAVATDLAPEIYLWLGDNVYADTIDEDVMQAEYDRLAETEEFIRLAKQAQLIATWDDHDYGANDAGKDFPIKEASRAIFLEFWQEPTDSERWTRDGIYTAHSYEDRLQVIVLDTRYNRDGLTLNDGTGKNDYLPGSEPANMLGEAQWSWLEERLREPAELRLVASSVQLGHSYNGFESWTLFPSERQRFVDLVRSTRAEGVVVLSGDVHWGEVSRLQVADGYDLIDITSSGINQDWPFVESNDNRVGQPVPEFNVGFLDIDWQAASLTAFLYDATGAPRLEQAIDFGALRFAPR